MMYWKAMATAFLVAGGLAFTGTDAWSQAPAGKYTLTQVNGKALPMVTERNAKCQDEVLSGTLTLKSDGEWEVEYAQRETCGTKVHAEREREDGHYTLEGQRIRFSNDTETYDPNDIDIDELGMGTMSSTGLMVTLQDGRTTLMFRRQ